MLCQSVLLPGPPQPVAGLMAALQEELQHKLLGHPGVDFAGSDPGCLTAHGKWPPGRSCLSAFCSANVRWTLLSRGPQREQIGSKVRPATIWLHACHTQASRFLQRPERGPARPPHCW